MTTLHVGLIMRCFVFRFLIKKAQYFYINIADFATIHAQSHKLESHLPVSGQFVRLFTEMIEKLYLCRLSNSVVYCTNG